MWNGVVGLVLAFACLGAFLVYGLPAEGEPPLDSRISFWLGAGFGIFFAVGLLALGNQRHQSRSRSGDALARIERYRDG